MAQKAANEDSVLILLSAQSPNNLKFPERRIILTQSHPKVLIGRSSSRSALGLIPALDNGYFDSPVMSREHAEIEADIPEQVVRIRDAGSMHGTLLNKEPLKTKVSRPLVSGDEIMFGSSIYRNQKTFTPATVTVGMEFQFRGQADQSPSRVFTVPDDCSTDENEPLDDNAPLKPHTSSCREVDPRVTKQRDAVLQVDGIIEIDSDSDSDSDMLSDAAPHGCISIVSSDGSHDDLDSGVMAADLDDDESISLTDDEETSSAPASPVESIDLDEFGFANNSGNSSPSWNSVSTDTRSEHEDVQPISGHNSEDEQGVFLYDTESEEMDDIDPVDEYVPGPQPLVYDSAYQPPQTAAAPQQFTLPSIDTAVHSQQGIPPQFNCQLPPVMLMRPVPRQPSPSDALLPVTRPQLGSGDDAVVTVQSLGFKSGKLDYFEAREQNRITVAHSRNHFAPDANAFVQDSSDTVTNAENAIPLITTDNLLVMSSATENGHASPPAFDKEAHTVIMPQVIQPINGRMNSQGSEEPSESTHEPISLAAEDTISPESLKETSEMGIEDQDPSLPPRAASPARTLFWMEQRGKFRAKMEMEASSVAQGKALQAAERSEKSKGAHIGKRKAADISEETEQELLWHEQSASDQQAVRSSPGPVQPGIEMELSTLSFHDTLEEEPTAVRPTKMRKIAERVGYAALGGATVGAMVLTSLIYTAPNFA